MSDTNVCSIGFAMDALHRLQLRSAVAAEAKAALDSAHSVLTVRCPETLARTQPPGFSLASPELWTQLEQPLSLAAAKGGKGGGGERACAGGEALRAGF